MGRLLIFLLRAIKPPALNYTQSSATSSHETDPEHARYLLGRSSAGRLTVLQCRWSEDESNITNKNSSIHPLTISHVTQAIATIRMNPAAGAIFFVTASVPPKQQGTTGTYPSTDSDKSSYQISAPAQHIMKTIIVTVSSHASWKVITRIKKAKIMVGRQCMTYRRSFANSKRVCDRFKRHGDGNSSET